MRRLWNVCTQPPGTSAGQIRTDPVLLISSHSSVLQLTFTLNVFTPIHPESILWDSTVLHLHTLTLRDSGNVRLDMSGNVFGPGASRTRRYGLPAGTSDRCYNHTWTWSKISKLHWHSCSAWFAQTVYEFYIWTLFVTLLLQVTACTAFSVRKREKNVKAIEKNILQLNVQCVRIRSSLHC